MLLEKTSLPVRHFVFCTIFYKILYKIQNACCTVNTKYINVFLYFVFKYSTGYYIMPVNIRSLRGV